MTDRKPDSGFPGRDNYGRRFASTREGGNRSLLIAGIAALLLLIGVVWMFGKTERPGPAAPPPISGGN
jgi:hypothetical protein